MRGLAHWTFGRLLLARTGYRPPPVRWLARSFAIACAGLALLYGTPATAAVAPCSGTLLLDFVTKEGIVGWGIKFTDKPQCASVSLVVVMDLIESDRTVHKLSFTVILDPRTQNLVRTLGIDAANFYVGPYHSGTEVVLNHRIMFSPQTVITKVKMFATLTGFSCTYEGISVIPGTPRVVRKTESRDLISRTITPGIPSKPVIVDCLERSGSKLRRPH